MQGLRIRQRMREQYGGDTKVSGTLGVGDVGSSPAVASGYGDHDGCDDEGGVEPATAGGFLTGVEDVIQPYSLLQPTHVVFSSPPRRALVRGRAAFRTRWCVFFRTRSRFWNRKVSNSDCITEKRKLESDALGSIVYFARDNT